MVKGFFIFLIAFTVTRVGKRMSAGDKHLIWFLVILSCLIIPIVWLFLPTAQTTVQIPVSTTEFARILTAPLVSREYYLELVAKSNAYAALSGQIYGRPLVWWQVLSFAIWTFGIAVLLMRGIAARLKVRRITVFAEQDSRRQPDLDELIRKFRIRKQVTVLISKQCAMPFTFGIARPRIVLPRSASNWTHNRLRSVLIHELAHIRNEDYLIASIAQIVCTLFWFVPYLWIAYARLVREGEKNCDGSVIDEGIRGTEYANHLVDIVHSSRGYILLPTIYPTIGRTYMLRERIQNILSLKPNYLRKKYRAAGILLVACFCCVLPLFAVTCATRP
jgi:beta-lactamase regulating signal transducer with metallopeptidase domain